ncbi:MAG: hypothetical protein EB084_09230, partial [Proteobacteria bacterium]|nr:hypothetical protein [Pseudomonadota bacterium]
AVAPLPDESGGRRLVAWVVASVATCASLPTWMAERVPAFLVPSAFIALDTLPLTANGKVDLRALPSATMAPAPRHVAPRDDLERSLVEIWETVLDVTPIGVTDGFFDLGGHSLSGARVVAHIEQHLGCRISLTTLFEAQTISRVAAAIRGDSVATPPDTIVPLEVHEDGTPMYWVHSLGGDAGGGFFYYRPVSRRMAPEHSSFGVRAPKRSFDRIAPMAEAYVNALLAVHPGGPLNIGGFCFGGIVAYEMGRLLRARGCEMGVVVLVDTARPDHATEGKPSLGRRAARHVRTLAAMTWGQRWRTAKKKVRSLIRKVKSPSDSRSSHLVPLEDAMDLSAYPPDYIDAAKRHWEALQRYAPGRYDGRVLLFCEDGDDATIDGWRRLIDGPLEVHPMSCPHDAMMEAPNAARIAEVLRAALRGNGRG